MICAAALLNVSAALATPAVSPGGLRVARTLAWGLLPIVFAVLAALIVARQPRNRVGWILMTPAIGMVISNSVDTYMARFTIAPPPSLPVLLMAWYQSWSWLLLIFPLPLMMLLFPTGRPLSPRWRWVQVYAVVLFFSILLLATFGINLQPSNSAWSLPNPIGFIPNDQQTLQLIIAPLIAGLAVLVIASAVALFVRYRRAATTERLQIKWLLYASAVFVLFYVPVLALQGQAEWLVSGLTELLLAVSIMLFPIAVAVAILRYRLWEIDVIINRTLVYVPLTAIIAGIFAAASTLLQKTFVALTGTDSLASTILATMVVVATFNPIKDRVQKTVDRVFKELPDPTKRLKPFQDVLRSRVSQLDMSRTTRRFLEEAVAAFDAEGGAAYRVSNGSLQRIHTTGHWNGEEKMGAPVECGGAKIAHIALGVRRRGQDYADTDRRTLALVADAVSQAIEEDGACRAAGE
jgi:hypothetical protein